jgi:hypothetical protein
MFSETFDVCIRTAFKFESSNMCCDLSAKHHVSCPYKTAGEIIVLYRKTPDVVITLMIREQEVTQQDMNIDFDNSKGVSQERKKERKKALLFPACYVEMFP